MTNFTAEQIIKINEIFSRVVDCKGNLKVFRGFDWSLTETGGKFNNQIFPIVYTREYVDSANNTKYKDTFDRNEANQKQSDEQKFNKIHENGLNTFYLNPKTMLKIGDADIKTLGITASNFKIGDIKNNQNIDQYFSILLNKFPNEIKKDDLVILYTAFYELLQVCDFKFDSDKKVLYINIFQKLIEYFKDGKNSFYVYTQKGGTEEMRGENWALNMCFKIHQILCLLLSKINWSNDGSGEQLTDDELREILGDLFGIFADFRKAIWEAIGIIIKNKVLRELTKGSKNIIYYGAPGTGKTKFVKDCLDILDTNRARTEWVQFHSGFEYEDFIDGIKPNGIQNGNLNLALTNGIFKEFCLKAAQNEKENFFFIVDEINRADIAAVFGETLSLLEENYRGESIKNKNFPLSNQEFFIPANIYFIGMMNDVDKSIDCFDLALRRRFAWVLMECNYEVVENVTDEDYTAKCKNLNQYITGKTYELNGKQEQDGLNLGRAYEIGHSYFLRKEVLNEEEIWNRHIEPILREYIRTQFGDRDAEDKLNIAREIFIG
ncbi:AAA family ATPase [Campylobacter concisus]|uniref:AAA family ATPase n=1 Tax=Campylobacter concisus TaxID=199 RepID=A0A7S9WWM1_9BACT|nr:AAA family ATPase [Campylobacter concisus]QPH96054.1 AAA family ATPase [Campylobacter concisus]